MERETAIGRVAAARRPSLRRIGEATFVVTPPGELDQATGAALTETVASLASEAPNIVLDLTNVLTVDESAVRLLLRLAALARGAGGRLLAACPSGASEWLELHDVDRDPDAASAWLAHWVGV